jgi:hypothetical protein
VPCSRRTPQPGVAGRSGLAPDTCLLQAFSGLSCLTLLTVVSLSTAVRQALPARTVARSSRYSKYTWCSSIACRYPCSYASTSSLRPWGLFCSDLISPLLAAVEAWAYLSGALYFLSEARRQAYSPLPRPYVWLYERDCVGAGMRFLPGRPWLPRRYARVWQFLLTSERAPSDETTASQFPARRAGLCGFYEPRPARWPPRRRLAV